MKRQYRIALQIVALCLALHWWFTCNLPVRAGEQPSHPAQPNSPFVDLHVLMDVVYEPARDVYSLALTISEPRLIQQLVIRLFDIRAGATVLELNEFFNPDQNLFVEMSTKQMEPGGQYEIRIFAFDHTGNSIFVPEGNSGNQLTPILASQQIRYNPPPPQPVSLVIGAVRPVLETGELAVDLNLSGGDRVDYLAWQIVAGNGQGLNSVQNATLQETGVVLPMPAPMRTPSVEDREFTLRMTAVTFDGLSSEQALYPFTIEGVPPPSFGERMGQFWEQASNALYAQPSLLIAIIAVLMITTLALVFWPNRRGKRSADLERPPANPPSILYPSSTPKRRLYLEIIETADARDRGRRTITNFPCTIGRTEADINIQGDSRISRRHVRISERNGQLLLSDLESRNGTFVNGKQLGKNQAVALGSTTEVKLGPNTRIRLYMD